MTSNGELGKNRSKSAPAEAAGGKAAGRPRRTKRNDEVEDEEAAFHPKWQGVEKKAQKSRAELLGVDQPRIPRSVMKKMSKDDPRYVEEASVAELEDMALDKSKEVTDNLRNVLKVTQETEEIGAKTLHTLHEQGEQIHRVQDKAAQLDQELTKGEKLLNKLGPLFSCFWAPKKGKKIRGATGSDGEDPSDKYNTEDAKKRRALMTSRGDVDDESLSKMDRVKKQMDQQDEMLDDVSSSLANMKNMANDMGTEMDKQDKELDSLTGDVDELNSRLKQDNERGARLLGKGKKKNKKGE